MARLPPARFLHGLGYHLLPPTSVWTPAVLLLEPPPSLPGLTPLHVLPPGEPRKQAPSSRAVPWGSASDHVARPLAGAWGRGQEGGPRHLGLFITREGQRGCSSETGCDGSCRVKPGGAGSVGTTGGVTKGEQPLRAHRGGKWLPLQVRPGLREAGPGWPGDRRQEKWP